jgi:hypothetical protein
MMLMMIYELLKMFYEIEKRDMFYNFDDVLKISCYVL